jgi:hypothetical protein
VVVIESSRDSVEAGWEAPQPEYGQPALRQSCPWRVGPSRARPLVVPVIVVPVIVVVITGTLLGMLEMLVVFRAVRDYGQ